MTTRPLYGILGGMGTAAGLRFQRLFFETCNRRGVAGDQAYPEWVYLNASLAPDRTSAVAGNGTSPVPYLAEMMRTMQSAGVVAAVVACNTAHAFYDEVFAQVPIPWVHLQNETARALSRDGVRKIGVLATDGTLRARLYHRALAPLGIEAVEPAVGGALQAKVMSAVYDSVFGLKFTGAEPSDRARKILLDAIEELNAPAVVAGCTEISVAFSRMDVPVTWYDPMASAAETLFDLWKGERSVESLRP